MTFEQIEYFLSCASCLNFSLAAKYHYVSVSTLSRNITSLEDELGVKLFVRGYHGHSLTKEGKRFYNFAEKALCSLTEFWESIGRVPAGSGDDSQLRIACYPFDSMFEKIVETVSGFPSDWLGKAYHIYFIKSGTMPDSILSGRMHIGVDSASYLRPYGDLFTTHSFFRSPFRLVVDKDNPLAARESIDAEELIAMHDDYSNFLPNDIFLRSYSERIVNSESDLQELGEITIANLPHILPRLSTMDLNTKAVIIPRELNLPALSDMVSVKINGNSIYTDYVLFWKSDNNDPAIAKFMEILEYSK